MIFLDTNVIFALLNKNDSQHNLSIEAIEHVRSYETVSIITDYVILELFTITRLRIKSSQKKDKINNFINNLYLEEVSNIFYKSTTEDMFKKVSEQMIESNDKLSFVDHSLIQHALQYKTAQILTFDNEINKYLKNNNLKERVFICN